MKNETAVESPRSNGGAGAAPQLPPSRRTTYQFPVYRWIGWLAVAGFAVGLTVMFFISGMFGVPAPLGWASLVILFTLGTLLLDRPRLLLLVMMFYFALMPGNRFLGLLGLPLPGFLDELFFLPLIAVIVMNWIQRRQLREATAFPLVFGLISALSWYVNGHAMIFTAIQVTLIMLKSYIVWYFCRLTCTFDDERQLLRWVWGYVIYVAAQFLYNMLWQQGPWPKFHPDHSGGVFGPDATGGAHIVGYLSVFALFLLTSWWVSLGRTASRRQRFWAMVAALVITYDFVFMTDTKHALILFPLAFWPFLFHPALPIRTRTHLALGGLLFILTSSVYFHIAAVQGGVLQQIENIKNSPKGEMFYAVTVDFPHLVPYPLLGAGPGRFTSNQAVDARMPLARRYIIPYDDQQRRMSYWGRQGDLAQASILGIVRTDLFKLMGEFGWLGTVVFYSFYVWVIFRLFRKSLEWPMDHLASGLFLGLACSIIFLIFITFLIGVVTVPVLVFPLWIMIGRMWDMKVAAEPSGQTEP